jgi:hypothetical protein
MAIKLEKTCKISKVKVGERYSLTNYIESEYVFFITSKTKKDIEITYLDGTKGLYFNHDPLEVYEFPLTPVERELI